MFLSLFCSFLFDFKPILAHQQNSYGGGLQGVEVKLICPEVTIDLDLNDIKDSIPRFKEEVFVDIKFTPVSQMAEETHYKTKHEREEFHQSCWYKSKVNVAVNSQPHRYQSTMYLVPKDESYMSEVEFWMTGKKRRHSTKEDYFNIKISPDILTENNNIVFNEVV